MDTGKGGGDLCRRSARGTAWSAGLRRRSFPAWPLRGEFGNRLVQRSPQSNSHSTLGVVLRMLTTNRVCVNCWCTKPRFRLCTVMEAENPPVLTDKNLHGASGGPLEAEKWPPWLTVRSIAAEVPELGAGSLGNRGDSSQDMVRVVLEPQGTHSISFFSQLFSFGGKSSVLTSHQRRGQLSKPKYGFHSITGLYYYRTDPGELQHHPSLPSRSLSSKPNSNFS